MTLSSNAVNSRPAVQLFGDAQRRGERQHLADLGARVEVVVHRFDAVDLLRREPRIGLGRLVLDFAEHGGEVVVEIAQVAVSRAFRELEHDVQRRRAAEFLVDQLEALVDLGVVLEVADEAVLDFERCMPVAPITASSSASTSTRRPWFSVKRPNAAVKA